MGVQEDNANAQCKFSSHSISGPQGDTELVAV